MIVHPTKAYFYSDDRFTKILLVVKLNIFADLKMLINIIAILFLTSYPG